MATQPVSSVSRSRSRSAERVLDLLDLFFLGGEGGLTLTEISRRLKIPRSTALGFLQTMRERGYVAWDPASKLYSVGLRLVALANAASIHQTVQIRARPHLERLAGELHETALLHAYESNAIVAIDVAEGLHSVRYSVQPGKRWPLHATSAGKLYLAERSDAEVLELLAREELEQLTDHTIVDPEALLHQLANVRRDGYAEQEEEIIEGVAGFAAPVRGPDGSLVASLTVTGPAARIVAGRAAIVRALATEAAALSHELAEPYASTEKS